MSTDIDNITKAKDKAFDTERYNKQRAVFGVIVFESGQDLDPKPHICAMTTDGSWSWYSTDTKAMSVSTGQESRGTSL